MGIKTIEMSFSEWQHKFTARVINAGDKTAMLIEDEFQAEALAREAGDNRVWTLKTADEGEGEVLVNGLWSVGAIGFYITEEVYKDNEDYVVTR